jgi:hypothetical protein
MMSRKGMQAQKDYNQRRRDARNGNPHPIEYTTTVEQAMKIAGLGEWDGSSKL